MVTLGGDEINKNCVLNVTLDFPVILTENFLSYVYYLDELWLQMLKIDKGVRKERLGKEITGLKI
jgi:hypothetical protein